jgi:hypothetical protein
MSVQNYHSTLCNIPEQGTSHGKDEKSMVSKKEGNRTLRRPRHRQGDIINMDFKYMCASRYELDSINTEYGPVVHSHDNNTEPSGS